ncbi:MAG TPA: TerC family protein [Acidimicrobiales bacterium]|nr:TerC family protein [Acidimicrobiales bacterium]
MTLAAAQTADHVSLSVEPWHWVALVAFVIALLLIDVLVVHRVPHEISLKEAAVESAVWISIGFAFTGVVAWLAEPGQGGAAAGEYLGAFLIEKSLSVDNVFVWAVIFSYFAVPAKYQFRVLFWGVFGAIALRAAFIFAGVALLDAFTVTLVVFGVILLYTAYKLGFQGETQVDPDKSVTLRLVRRVVPSTDALDGQRLFTRKNGKRLATPLFAVLIMVEATDIIFAIDSIPAIFGVTTDVFIVFSAVTFAMLGLRALYFLVGGMQDRFRYLHYGLALILAFVGVKLILTFTADAFSFPSEDFHIPIALSLGIIIGTLVVTIALSLRADARQRALEESET